MILKAQRNTEIQRIVFFSGYLLLRTKPIWKRKNVENYFVYVGSLAVCGIPLSTGWMDILRILITGVYFGERHFMAMLELQLQPRLSYT